MAQHNRATLKEMQAKHPVNQSSQVFQPHTTDTPQLQLSQIQVTKEIRSFRKGSAPGPSGLRAEHLKVCVRSSPPNRTDRASTAITKLVNCMGGGNVPVEVAPYMCGARLFGALKKDGGLRPIAVGEIFRRLTSKGFSHALRDRAATILSPNQLGVGVPGGCEALAHTLRQVVEDGHDDPDLSILQVDLINAFNRIDRVVMLEEVEKLFPDCLSWVRTCYDVDGELMFGDSVILSAVGVHQGDPLASLLFSILLHPVVQMIDQEVPSLKMNAWYLDDGALVGSKEDLQKAVDIILREGPPRGLHLSTANTVSPPQLPKSTVWYPNNPTGPGCEDPLGRGIPRITEPGIVFLGTPIGSLQFCQNWIRSKIQKVKEITDHLPLLQDAHAEFVLLRSCLALPKIMFVLRTTDPTHNRWLWQEFDGITREALTRIIGSPVNDFQWCQAKLPVSLAGLGLKAAEDHAHAAYASSLLSSQHIRQALLDLQEDNSQFVIPETVMETLSSKQNEEATVENLQGVTQKAISYKIDQHNSNLLINNITREGVVRDVARLRSLSLPHAGDWLFVVPAPALGLHLRTVEFTVSVKYRLGIPIYTKTGQCPACKGLSDQQGDHAVSCGSEGERIARHNHLRDALFQAAVTGALAPSKEERALIPGTESKPADVLIPHWTHGRDTALDVTVVNPLQTTLVERAARNTEPGHALTYAFDWKMRKHGEACRREGMVFLPMAVESLGGWHDLAVEQIKKIATAQARQTGDEEAVAIAHLFQRLAVLLQKGNAALLLNRIPSFPEPHEDGQY